MKGADDESEGQTRQRDGPSGKARVLARTRNRLTTGNKGTWTGSPSKHPSEEELLA